MRADLKAFLAAHKGTNEAKRRLARTLHSLFSFAIEEERLTENPVRGVGKAFRTAKKEHHALDPEKDKLRYFPKEDAIKLLDTCREKMPAFFLLVKTAITTGMRRGELRALKFERINWTEGTITVIENLTRYGVGSPKNGKARRASMGRELHAALDLHWRSRGKSNGLVFLSEVRTALPNTTIDRAWRKLQTAAKLPYRKLHALRHTHSTLAISAGVDPVVVSEEAGRTLREALYTYFHFAPEKGKGSASKVEEVLGSVSAVYPERLSTAPKRTRTVAKSSKVVRFKRAV